MSVNAKQFDGLNKLCAGARTRNFGVNGATLTLDQMDELIDMIKPGKPDAIFLSKRSRHKLSSLRRASGTSWRCRSTSSDAASPPTTAYP